MAAEGLQSHNQGRHVTEENLLKTTRLQAKIMVDMRLHKNSVIVMTLVLCNIFYWIPLFFTGYLPISANICIGTVFGTLICGICMSVPLCGDSCEEQMSLSHMLRYYPIRPRDYRVQLYKVLLRLIGYQACIILVPMLISLLWAPPGGIIPAFCSNLISMTVLGTLLIEIQIMRMKVRL